MQSHNLVWANTTINKPFNKWQKCRFYLLAPRIIMKIPCKITIKASKIDPLANNQPYTRVCLTVSTNSPSRKKISNLSSCVRSCDDKNECTFCLFIQNWWPLINFRSNKWRLGQFTNKFNLDINKINYHLKTLPRVTSCPFRVTLSPYGGTLGSKC